MIKVDMNNNIAVSCYNFIRKDSYHSNTLHTCQSYKVFSGLHEWPNTSTMRLDFKGNHLSTIMVIAASYWQF